MADELAHKVRSLIRVDLLGHPKTTENVATKDGGDILGGSVFRRICLQPSGEGVLDREDMSISFGGRLERSPKVDGYLLEGVSLVD